MQLKEEFRTYEALRREHDTQIVQIALEAGLRITPDQWSSLLYGDNAHKSHMQSIIDKVCVNMYYAVKCICSKWFLMDLKLLNCLIKLGCYYCIYKRYMYLCTINRMHMRECFYSSL